LIAWRFADRWLTPLSAITLSPISYCLADAWQNILTGVSMIGMLNNYPSDWLKALRCRLTTFFPGYRIHQSGLR